MPVVINEFEVVTDASQAAQQPGAQQTAQGQSPGAEVTPYAIERVLRRHKRRMVRIRAY